MSKNNIFYVGLTCLTCDLPWPGVGPS